MLTDTITCLESHGLPISPYLSADSPGAQSLLVFLASLQDWAMYDDFTGTEERRLTGGYFFFFPFETQS
jgi:hypothetical protein